ncbi:MAG: DUF3192 domain-containing protein [Congregibacter sp.]
MMFARLAAVSTLLFLVSGCVFIDGEYVSHDDWKEIQRDNREAISQLEIGMSRDAAMDKLGTPSDSEAFVHEGEEVRVLFYRTQRKHSDGETSRDETTPVVFKNDQLIGWGHKTYAELR